MSDSSFKIYLAPLRGVTLRTYRNAFQRHFQGVDLAISPFIPTVTGLKVKPTLLKDVDINREQLMPVIPQIIGNRPDDVFNMCRSLQEAGHGEVNWNLGCPHRPVTRKKRGAGLLRHPDMIREVLDRVFSDESLQFSVKVRLGLDDPDELYGLVEMFNEYPLTEVIIHPRTAAQMYNGQVDLDRFEACMKRFVHPVVFNGDIKKAGDFLKLQERFPNVERWMIGRGLIVNPFLTEEIRGISCDAPARRERVAGFLDELLDGYSEELCGPGHILGRMKELWKYLALSFDGGDEMLRRIQQETSVESYRRLVDKLLRGKRAADLSAEG